MEPVRAAPSVAEMAEAWVTAKAGGRAQKRAGASETATAAQLAEARAGVWARSSVEE